MTAADFTRLLFTIVVPGASAIIVAFGLLAIVVQSATQRVSKVRRWRERV